MLVCRQCGGPRRSQRNRSLVCGSCHYANSGGKDAARIAAQRRTEAKATRPRPSHCEICGARPDGSVHRVLSFDHNHATGAFRGWLCRDCNHTLGKAGDNPRILRALAEYLERAGNYCTRPLIR